MSKIQTRRQKGKDLEDFVADEIVRKGLDPKARRDGGSGSGNREKGDISTSAMVFGRNLGIECKNQETLAIPAWWKQTEKLELVGREPVLVYKVPKRNPRVYLVSIYLDTFLDMLVALEGVDNVKENIVDTHTYDKTNHLRELENTISALQRIKNNYKRKLIDN